MDTTLIKALEKQATHELTASYAYLAMANWCASEDYKGYAAFFNKQAEEEREHAKKFMDHLLDRGELPLLGVIGAPKCQFDSILEVAKLALALEIANSKGIVEAYELSLQVKDYASQSMLLWFIEEQVEEEAWANSMVTLTSRANCANAMFDLDRHIVKTLRDECAPVVPGVSKPYGKRIKVHRTRLASVRMWVPGWCATVLPGSTRFNKYPTPVPVTQRNEPDDSQQPKGSETENCITGCIVDETAD
jgi:ferritin